MTPVALAALKILAIHLLTQTPDDAAARHEARRERADHRVTLVVAIEAEDARGRPALFAGAPRVDLGDGAGAREARAWPDDEPLQIAWSKVEPAEDWADNDRGGFHWDEIPYRETAWPADDPRALAREADVRATILPDRGGLGTMAFKVAATSGASSKATPGMESRFRGGLSGDVMRVSYRRDDTFLGYLTELFNTPYIWASAGTGAQHQAERQIGSDCADFICYGLRRSGKKIEYGYTGDVPKWGGGTPLFSIAGVDADGRYVDAKGKTIPVGERGMKPGDLILFKGHVAAFLHDRAPEGVLDENDEIVHTAWAPPSEESFRSAARWTATPFTVWRVR
ncbi:MAG TPA: hypothetical protein VMV18_02005 [bacterium]|nr:hypothetical protein [bacterium]